MTARFVGIFYVIFRESSNFFFVMILESLSACVILMSNEQNSQELTEDGVEKVETLRN